MAVWERRLEEVESGHDPMEELLAELESNDPERSISTEAEGSAIEPGLDDHCVQLPDGVVAVGTWAAIVEQLRQARAPGETVAQFMRRLADEAQARAGVHVPAEDPRGFVLAGAQAGFWQIEY